VLSGREVLGVGGEGHKGLGIYPTAQGRDFREEQRALWRTMTEALGAPIEGARAGVGLQGGLSPGALNEGLTRGTRGLQIMAR